jgi:hypothetical protein
LEASHFLFYGSCYEASLETSQAKFLKLPLEGVHLGEAPFQLQVTHPIASQTGCDLHADVATANDNCLVSVRNAWSM